MITKFLISMLSLAIAFPFFVSSASAENGASAASVRVIEVDGTGEARGRPDLATLNLAI